MYSSYVQGIRCGLLAEGLLSVKGKGCFHAYSAGMYPGTLINPFAAELMQNLACPVRNMRCKRRIGFTVEPPMPLDCVITLCGNTASMQHPAWPGNLFTGNGILKILPQYLAIPKTSVQVFRRAFDQLEKRIRQFIFLPHDQADRDLRLEKINLTASFNGLTRSSSL